MIDKNEKEGVIPMSESEIVRLRRQIEEAYEAGMQGLTGLASGTSNHRFIQAKLEHVEACHSRLVELVGVQEAIQIVYETQVRIVGE